MCQCSLQSLQQLSKVKDSPHFIAGGPQGSQQKRDTTSTSQTRIHIHVCLIQSQSFMHVQLPGEPCKAYQSPRERSRHRLGHNGLDSRISHPTHFQQTSESVKFFLQPVELKVHCSFSSGIFSRCKSTFYIS